MSDTELAAEPAAPPPKPTRVLKLRHVVAISLATAVLAASATAYASHQFNDVPNSNPFHDHIDWLADVGVTGGFPDGGFHPNESVQRQQMAAFMARFYNVVSGLTAVDNGTSASASGIDSFTNVPGMSAQVTIPPGTTGRVTANFAGEVVCNSGDNQFLLVLVVRPACEARLLINGAEMAPGPVGLADSDDANVDDLAIDQEAFSVQGISSANLPPGTYTITGQLRANDADGNVDDQLTFDVPMWTLVVEAHLNDNALS